jgi:hypothetical protein
LKAQLCLGKGYTYSCLTLFFSDYRREPNKIQSIFFTNLWILLLMAALVSLAINTTDPTMEIKKVLTITKAMNHNLNGMLYP